jgi:Family of unknown function (DUF5714)
VSTATAMAGAGAVLRYPFCVRPCEARSDSVGDDMTSLKPLASQTECGVCGRPLIYAEESVVLRCELCGRQESALIRCPAGHYVCDACHGMAALEVLAQVAAATRSADPAVILERVMAHPAVPMHGPEHHAIVPASIVVAAANAGAAVPGDALERVLERARKVPGGWCGFYGACGAAIGLGIAVSVLTAATPVKGKERSLAMAATSFALSRMLDDQPRCCKRASRVAIEAAVEFLSERLGIRLDSPTETRCSYSLRNAQCARLECRFFDAVAFARLLE